MSNKHNCLLFVQVTSMVLLINCQSIAISVDKTPIVYGETVILHCIVDKPVDGCDFMTDRTWEGGPNNVLLLYNGVSVNSSKYQELTDDPCKKFSLMIYNFTERDGNTSYSCSIGFSKTRKYLSVDSSNFLRKPLDNHFTINYNTTDSVMYLSLLIDTVFPEPKCICKIRNSSSILMVNIKVENHNNAMLYNIDYFAGITVNKSTCGSMILVSCTALSYTVLDIRRNLSCSNTRTFIGKKSDFNSKDADENKSGDLNIRIVVGVTCAAILAVSLIAIVVLFIVKKGCGYFTTNKRHIYIRTEQG